MTSLKKFNLQGKELGNVKADPALADAKTHSQLVKNYIIAIRENARQWSASTKTRAEVVHTTKKPYRQKGTGNARQGTLVAPQFRGGGRVHTPRPKFDQHVRINKKERQAAIRCLIGEKIRSNNVYLIDNTEMKAPKTKEIAQFLKGKEWGKRILFLGEGTDEIVEVAGKKVAVSVKCDKHQNFARSLRNLPNISFGLAKNINGYDLMLANTLVMTEAAYEEIRQWLS